MEPGRAGGTVTVHVSGRTVFLTVAVVATIWLAFQLTSFLVVVFAAVLLATAVDQPTTWLQRRGIPRPVGILLIYVVLALVMVGMIAALIPLLNAEIKTLRSALPSYSDNLQRWVQRFAPNADPQSQLSFSRLNSQLSGHLGSIAGGLRTVTLTAGRVLVLIFVTFVIAFFLASDPTMGTQLVTRFASQQVQARWATVAASARVRIGGWARGQLIIAVSFGLAMGIGLRLIGVPYAASLGTIAAVLELIPYVGGAVTLILALLMALSVGIPQVIAVVVLYIVLVNIESHVLAPILLGHVIGLPSVAILLALVAGVELLGILGALLAVPATVIIWAIVEEIWPGPEVREQRRPTRPKMLPGGRRKAAS